MNKYNVWVKLEGEYEIEADSEEEAFILASYFAIQGGDWYKTVEPLTNKEKGDIIMETK